MARSPLPTLPTLALRRTARRARRSLAVRWVLVAVAAALAAVQAARLGAAAEDARDAWGEGRPVAVASRDLGRGHVVAAADVVVETWPAAVVPAAALAEAPTGRVLSADVVAGEAVVAGRVAPGGMTGAAALVPDGWRALAVPTSSAFGAPAPPLAVGDVVDLLAPDPVATGAVVVAVGDDAVTVAVPAGDAPALADALAVGVVTVALRGAE